MKKYKFFSLLLVFSFLIQSAVPVAYATNWETPDEQFFAIEDGFFYSSMDSEKFVVILTNDKLGIVNASIKIGDDHSYEFYYDNNCPIDFDIESVTSRNTFIEYMELHLDEGRYIDFVTEEICEGGEDEGILPLDGAGGDTAYILTPQLRELVGNEYTVTLSTRTYKGHTMKITEDLALRIEESRKLTWSKTFTIAGFISEVLGKVAQKVEQQKLCKGLGIVFNAAAKITQGSTVEFACIGITGRHVYVDNIDLPCNSTYRYVTHYAIGQSSLSKEAPSTIYTTQGDYSYSHGTDGTYFRDYTVQIEDAYAYYWDFYA